FVARWESLPLWRSQAALPGSVRDAQRRVRLSNSATGLANSLRGAGAGSEPATLGEAPRIAVPTLILAGELDPKYVAHGHRLAASIAGSTLQVVEGAGHAIHLERPREFALLVSTFLSKVPIADG